MSQDVPIWEIERNEAGQPVRMLMVGYRQENRPTRRVGPAKPIVEDQQARLDFTPAASELAQALRNRETRAQKMLDRLRMGPATTKEMNDLGGSGFSSRLKELKRAGHEITVEGGPERFVYTLRGE